MKTHILTTLFILFICLSGISIAQDQAAIETKIREINQKLSEEMVKGNFSTDHYADDAISLQNQQPMLVGIEAIKKGQEGAMAAGFKFETFIVTPAKIMVNGNMVTEIGAYSMSMKMPNMPDLFKEDGKYLTL